LIVLAARISVLCLLVATPALAQSVSDEDEWSPPTMDCSVGPITKIYGAQPWLVFGCADGKSIEIVSMRDSPASPAYFMFEYGADGYGLRGQGMGDRAVTDAAHAELRAFKDVDAAALNEEVRKAGQPE